MLYSPGWNDRARKRTLPHGSARHATVFGVRLMARGPVELRRLTTVPRVESHSPQGPEGLAGDKRVVVAISRGGIYDADTPTAAGEHLETYLRWVFAFIGVANPEFIAADGVRIGPEQHERALAGALQAAAELAAA